MKHIRKKTLLGTAVVAGAALLGTCMWALQSALGISQYDIALPRGMEGLDGSSRSQICTARIWRRSWSRPWSSSSPTSSS